RDADRHRDRIDRPAERYEDPRGREKNRAEPDRADEVEARGLPGDPRREDAPGEREPSRADRNVDEEDPAPVDRREESADERPDRRADRGRGAHDPELRATPATGDGLTQEAEPIRDERGRRDRLIDAEHGKKKDRARGGGAGRGE